MAANEPLVIALPKGRILEEVAPMVRAAGIEPGDERLHHERGSMP